MRGSFSPRWAEGELLETGLGSAGLSRFSAVEAQKAGLEKPLESPRSSSCPGGCLLKLVFTALCCQQETQRQCCH